jgi:hypothetical protein
MRLRLRRSPSGSKCDSTKTVTKHGPIASPAVYAADRTTFSKLTIAAVVLVSHAAAGPTTFPPLKSGAGVRCVGKVLAWRPMEMTVEFSEPTVCGAVDGVLRITPGDVQKVDGNVHPFWHAVTRPAA